MNATVLFGLEHGRDPIDPAELQRKLDELLVAREQSDPGAPVAPESISYGWARGKDEVARLVLADAYYLMLQVAGWTINHIVGRALAEKSGHVADANSHQMEIEGQRYAALHVEHGDEDAERGRAVLRAAIGPTFCLAPIGLTRELRDGFLALNLGETPRLLAPSNVPLKGKAFTLAHLRLITLEHVFFQWGKGGKRYKEKALKNVEGAIGRTSRRILGWERVYLPKFFSKGEIRERTKAAKAAGALLDLLSKDPTREIGGAVGDCYARLQDYPLASLKELLSVAETKSKAPRHVRRVKRT